MRDLMRNDVFSPIRNKIYRSSHILGFKINQRFSAMYYYLLSCGAEDGHSEVTLCSDIQYSKAEFASKLESAIKEVIEQMMPDEIRLKKSMTDDFVKKEDKVLWNRYKKETSLRMGRVFHNMVPLLCKKYGFSEIEYEAVKYYGDFDEVAIIPAVE